MIRRGLIAILVLFALAGLCTNALGQEIKNQSINSNETLTANETLAANETLIAPGNDSNENSAQGLPDFSLVKFAQPTPAMIKVPINILNNTTKEVWTNPGDKPAFVFAGITNNGNLSLDIYTISINPDTQERAPPQLAGTALPNGDGVIVYGKYVAIAVKCENSTTMQYCTGLLETANWFP